MTVDEDRSALSLLKGTFEFEESGAYASPSGAYYWFRKRQQIASLLERNSRRLSLREGSIVADLGCGSGADLFVIRQILGRGIAGCSFVGVEADEEALRLCRLRGAHHGDPDDVSFVAGDVASRLPFQSGAVTVLYSSEVIEHLPEPERLLREAARVVHAGGYFLLTTPNQPNPLQRSFWFPHRRRALRHAALRERASTEAAARNWGSVPLHGHVSLWTTRLLDRALAAHGFRLVDFGRGALHYGSSRFADRESILAGMFAMQAILDIFPPRLTRRLSDQTIALYQRGPS